MRKEEGSDFSTGKVERFWNSQILIFKNAGDLKSSYAKRYLSRCIIPAENMSHEPSDKNLGEFFSEYSKTKDTIAQLLAALSRGIAQLISQPFKGLKNKLISLIAILLLLFNPLSDGIVGFIFKQIFKIEISEIGWYKNFLSWWPYLFAGAILLTLSIMVWEQLTRKPLPPTQFRNPAIKGLLSFEQSDAEIFKKLQREADVQQVMSALTHQNFRFGVLTGVSGCGKSSLLKAGLLPALAEQNRRVVVATLTDEPPLESVQKALTAQLSLRFEGNAPNLQPMLDAALQATGNAGFILILDQFEQFFTQNRTEESREPFIQELWKAYLNADGLKILLSIRLDFMGRLHEIQQRLQYTLTANQNYFNLRKFKPEQAVRIFHIMSDEGKMEAFDEDFMLKMTKEELASKEDGLVAAADVQWVATALQQAEGFAFDEKTFRQNGGVQGMMQQYLQKLLETPNTFNLQQEALKVLLAFVDLDNNTRKGRLTAADLRQSFDAQISLDHLAANLEWLTQNRLLHRPGLAEAESPMWELAHERLIEPLRALANKALTGLDQANLLLNRRVNEWLANGKENRFLLTRKEYHTLQKNAKYLVIEPNKAAKEELMTTTRNQIRSQNWIGLTGLAIILALGGIQEMTWWKVEMAAKTDIEKLILGYHAGRKGEVVTMLDSLSKIDARRALHIAGKLGFDEKQKAYTAIWHNIKNSILEDSVGRKETIEWLIAYLPDETFVGAADSLPQLLASLLSKEKGSRIIQQVAESAEKIEDKCSHAKTFGSLAESALKLGNAPQGLRFFQQAEQRALEIKAEEIELTSSCTCIIALAKSALIIGQPERGLRLLKQAEQCAKKMTFEATRADVLGMLAESVLKLGDSEVLWLLQSANEIESESSRIVVFRALAQSAAKIGNSEQGLLVLNQVEQSALELDAFSRAWVFCDLAESAVKMGELQQMRRFFQQAERNVKGLENTSSRAWIFIKLAESASKIGDVEQQIRLLKQAEQCAKETRLEYESAEILGILAESALELGDSEQALWFLKQVEKSAKEIENENLRARVFGDLAEAAAKMGDAGQGLRFSQQAEQSARKIGNERSRARVFAHLAKPAAKMGDALPEETKRFLSTLESHTSGFEAQSQAIAIHLRGLSQAYAELGEYRKAYALAERIEYKYPEKVFALIHLQKRYKERSKK